MERKTFNDLMAVVQFNYAEEMEFYTEEEKQNMIEIYYRAFEMYEEKEFHIGMANCLADNKYFPSILQLRKYVENEMPMNEVIKYFRERNGIKDTTKEDLLSKIKCGKNGK